MSNKQPVPVSPHSLPAVSPVQLIPFVSESPLAPSPGTVNQQLSSASSSAHRALHFGAPGSFLPVQPSGTAQVYSDALQHTDYGKQQHDQITANQPHPVPSKQTASQHLFEQAETLWQGSHASQLPEFALPDQLHSSSMDPESSSSPDKSPHKNSHRPPGAQTQVSQDDSNITYSGDFHSGAFSSHPFDSDWAAQQRSLPSSQTASPDAHILPSSPAQHSTVVPTAVFNNATEADHAAAVTRRATISPNTSVLKPLLKNVDMLNHAAASAVEADRSQDQASSQPHKACAAVSVSEAAAAQPQQHHSITAANTTTPMLIDAAVTPASSKHGTPQQHLQSNHQPFTPVSKASADFTRLSTDTDGQLNIVERVYIANPKALASIAVSDPTWRGSVASVTGTESAEGAATSPVSAAAASSPVAAALAAEALLEASLSDLAQEPEVPTTHPNPAVPPSVQHSELAAGQCEILPDTNPEWRCQPLSLTANAFPSNSRVAPAPAKPQHTHNSTSEVPSMLEGQSGQSPQPAAVSTGVHSTDLKIVPVAPPPQHSRLASAQPSATASSHAVSPPAHPIQPRPADKELSLESGPKESGLASRAQTAHLASNNSKAAELQQQQRSTYSPVLSAPVSPLRPATAQATSLAAHRGGSPAHDAQPRQGSGQRQQHSPHAFRSPPSDREVLLQRVAELQRQLDTTSRKLQVETESRYAAACHVAIQRREAAAAEKRMRDQYETRLRDKQIDLNAALHKLQGVQGMDPKAKLAGAAEVTLTEAEVRKLRKDMQEQEALIQGYQAENEAAVQLIKKLKLDHAHTQKRFAEESAKLQHGIAQHQEPDLQAKAEHTDRLSAVLKLESQLDSERELAAQHEAELRAELQQARREKMELEAKLGGLDLNIMEAEDLVVKQVQAEKDSLLSQLRCQMEDMQRQHDAMAAELHSKLQWYADNQDLVNHNSGVVKQQANTISALKAQLSQQQGTAPKGLKTDKSKIKELEGDVQSLKAALKARHPDSLPVLIAAAKPSPQESAIVTELQSKLKTLQAALVRKDEEMDQELRSLRQQHDQLTLQFKARRPLQGQENKQRRVQELEGQLQEVRNHYHQKIRSLEHQLQEASRRGSSPSKAASPPKHSNAVVRMRVVKTKQNAAAKRELQQSLAEQMALVEQLQQQIQQLKSQQAGVMLQEQVSTGGVGSKPQPQLDTGFTDAIRARSHNAQHTVDWRPPSTSHAGTGHYGASKLGAQAEGAQHAGPAEVQRLTQALAASEQRAAAAELAVGAVQMSCNEAVEQSTRLQAEHQRQLNLVFQQHTCQVVEVQRNVQTEESLRWRQHLAALEGQFRGAKDRAERLEEELRAARACIPWTPAAHEFAQLEKKITELEAEQQQSAQNSPLHDVLSTQQQALLAQPALRPSLQVNHVQDQDKEIERFRTELESILAIAQELQQQ